MDSLRIFSYIILLNFICTDFFFIKNGMQIKFTYCNIYLNVTKEMLLKLPMVTFKINVTKDMLLKLINGVV